MTAEMPASGKLQQPLIGDAEGNEKPRDLLAEIRVLLLSARQLNLQAKSKKAPKVKQGLQASAQAYLNQADELIAQQLGVDTSDPYYHHDPRVVGLRHTLREEAIAHEGSTSRASFEVGRKAFVAARAEDVVPDARMRAAHDYND